MYFQKCTYVLEEHVLPFLHKKRVHKIWGNRELSPLHAAIKQITPPILNMADRVERLKSIVRCLSIVNLK